MRILYRALVFTSCFLAGLSLHAPFDGEAPAADKTVLREAPTREEKLQRRTDCSLLPLTPVEQSQLDRIRRQYDLLLARQRNYEKKLLEEQRSYEKKQIATRGIVPTDGGIVDTEERNDLEWKRYELRKIYESRFSEEARTRCNIRK
jgi:hypothetical protein